MTIISNSEASANILAAVERGALVQGKWHGRDGEGREIACLLGAIHPSVESPSDCNGDLMPMWLAELTPTLFDGMDAKHVIPIARRYGELVGRWHVLSPRQWDAILTRFLIRCIDDAVTAARPVSEGKPYWPAVESACAQCRAAIESGDAAARDAAEAAARAAVRDATRGTAGAASEATARAALAAVRGTAEAAAAVVAWAAGAAVAVAAAGAAAGAAIYHSLFTFVLDQIEAELAST